MLKLPEVVILCGGMGTRLREETEFVPKPLVAIGGKPILWHIMKSYSYFGFNRFILCLGYKGEKIKEYFYNYELFNADFTVDFTNGANVTFHGEARERDWRVTLVDTGAQTLKGARIKKIERFVESDNFMLTYGDGVSNLDLLKLYRFHQEHGKIGTVTGVHPPSLFGELVTKNFRVTEFSEKPQTSSGTINGGFFAFNKKIFDYLTVDEECDFEKGPMEKLTADGELMVFEHRGAWACMDTHRDMVHLNKLWDSNKAFWKLWK
jgi:glucose-1-phosphate cytidylyltransferase